ncbi:MAG: mandelate racemase [Actinomycetota bacterium]|nr:mandelate racemase [Actinomycetota bacterium]
MSTSAAGSKLQDARSTPETADVLVESVDPRVYTVPTDRPESDGTIAWDKTTLVVCHVKAGGVTGLGYTYGSPAIATVIRSTLAEQVVGKPATDIGASWAAMVASVRNVGRPGVASMAISAVDVALWDVKARLLELPVSALLGPYHPAVPIYGSGGFTTYGPSEVARQLGGWAEQGIPRVKLKVGRRPEEDPPRLSAAREAVGDSVELFVDANGAFDVKRAIGWADRYASEWDVRWFEEPVSSDDLDGLAEVRASAAPPVQVAAGEYGFDEHYFRRMLQSQAVDCLQADATRCGGYTGFLRAAALCDAWGIDLSAHCAPQLSTHVCSAAWRLRHLEYFHDHVRIEHMLFDGCLLPQDGALRPDRSVPGLGLVLKEADAERYAV